MDAIESGIAVAGATWDGLWTLASSNTMLMISITIGLVGVGIALFFSIKSRLQGTRKRRGR